MTIATNNHVVLDERGIAWLAGTTCKVKEVVLLKLAWGLDAEQILRQLPHLSLSQIHSALAHYYDHQASLDAEISSELNALDARRGASRQPSRADLNARSEG
jgi:uncharacterized protein (DUF433 family)